MAGDLFARIDKDLKEVRKQTGLSYRQITKEVAEMFKDGTLNFDDRPKMRIKKNKKGQFEGIVFIAIMVFVVLITIFPMAKILDEINNTFQETDAIPQNAKDIVDENNDRFLPVYDGAIGLLIVLLAVALIGSSFLIDSNPFFFVISFVAFLIVFMVIAIMSNVVEELGTTPAFLPFWNALIIIPFVVNNFLQIFIVIGFVASIALFGKLRSSQ